MTRDDAERLVEAFQPTWHKQRTIRFYKDIQRVLDTVAERAVVGKETATIGAIDNPWRVSRFLRELGFETIDGSERKITVMWWRRKAV